MPQHNKVEQTKPNKTNSHNASATKHLGPAEVRQQGSHLPREKGTVLVHSYPFNSSLSRPQNSERHRQTRQTLRTETQYEVSYQYTPGIRRVTTTTTYYIHIYINLYGQETCSQTPQKTEQQESQVHNMSEMKSVDSRNTRTLSFFTWGIVKHLKSHQALSTGATPIGHLQVFRPLRLVPDISVIQLHSAGAVTFIHSLPQFFISFFYNCSNSIPLRGQVTCISLSAPITCIKVN